MSHTQIQFLGATGTVTGSKTALFVGTALEDRILIDCGLFQGLKENRQKNWNLLPVEPQSLGGVVITHAHIDHCGYLPRLVQDGFSHPIYCTSATAELMAISLRDAAHLQEEEARYANKEGFSKHTPALPLFSTEDVDMTLELVRQVKSSETLTIGKNLTVRFLNSGHILGSTSLQITSKAGEKPVTVVFSGDLGRFGFPILPNPEPPSSADYLVLESTYGDRIHRNTDPAADLAEALRKNFALGGVTLIPAFSIGRTQLILFYLRQLQDDGALDDVPIYLDSPMAIKVMETHRRFTGSLDDEMNYMIRSGINPLAPKSFRAIQSREESMALNSINGNAIIISASGMATGGRILHHLKHRVGSARNSVLFIGYQAEGTRGRAMLNGADSIKIHGSHHPVRCNVQQIDGLSAHADREEMLTWLRQFPSPPKHVYLNHGEPDACRAFSEYITGQTGILTSVPSYLESYTLE